MCLRLSLLSPQHHFHSICIIRLLFLVVQVDLILNTHLWVCLSPILELQHTFLPPKCYKLRSVPRLFSFSIILFWDPHLGLLKNLVACHSSPCLIRQYEKKYVQIMLVLLHFQQRKMKVKKSMVIIDLWTFKPNKIHSLCHY